ncbi:MAG: hypothetical protein JXR97_04645, partial [Planctomycetes bacterium]|nr:hypothetical protein [Planctomycetota bacterium]
PDLSRGWGGKVFQTAERFIECFSKYPELARHVHIYHPDLQGPMDVCELLWGSDIFVDLYEEAELVHEALSLITDTYIAFMEKWHSLIPATGEYSTHWGLLLKGQIMLRDDSAMNLSPEMYREFIMPYNQRLLDRYGGGIHACGKVDHWLPIASELNNFHCFNMSQPHYNDMETVYQSTVDKGLRILALSRETVEQDSGAGRNLRGLVQLQCW